MALLVITCQPDGRLLSLCLTLQYQWWQCLREGQCSAGDDGHHKRSHHETWQSLPLQSWLFFSQKGAAGPAAPSWTPRCGQTSSFKAWEAGLVGAFFSVPTHCFLQRHANSSSLQAAHCTKLNQATAETNNPIPSLYSRLWMNNLSGSCCQSSPLIHMKGQCLHKIESFQTVWLIFCGFLKPHYTINLHFQRSIVEQLT